MVQAIEVCIMLEIEETIGAYLHCFTWNVIWVHGLNSTWDNLHSKISGKYKGARPENGRWKLRITWGWV